MRKLNQGELLAWLNYWKDEVITMEKEESPEPPPFEDGQERQAYQQIKEMIQNQANLEQDVAQSQGKITEEWIEEKAGEMIVVILHGMKKDAINFIRSIVEKIK